MIIQRIWIFTQVDINDVHKFEEDDLNGSNVDTFEKAWRESQLIETGEHEVPILKRSTRPKKKPRRYDDYIACTTILSTKSGCYDEGKLYGIPVTDVDIPETFEQAIRSPQASEWKRAMEDEVQALKDKGVIKEEKLTDKYQTAISSRWVYAAKSDEHGNVTRYRARLVARGFSQRPGIDFNETFAPVARLASFRLVLALSTQMNLKLYQADINQAYLNANLSEPNYLKSIPGFTITNGKIYKIKKALYGLKQSGREWSIELNKHLTSYGFYKCKSEPCLFWLRDKNDIVIVLVYVDDIICATNNVEQKSKLFENLNQKYGIKNLGRLHYYLGIRVVQSNGTTSIDQSTYIDKVLNKYGYKTCNTVATPMETNQKIYGT